MPFSTPAIITVVIIVLGIIVFLFTYYRKRNQRDLKKLEAELNQNDNQPRR